MNGLGKLVYLLTSFADLADLHLQLKLKQEQELLWSFSTCIQATRIKTYVDNTLHLSFYSGQIWASEEICLTVLNLIQL